MCRELMEALLTSEAATRSDGERKPGERHGGVHEKDVITLGFPVSLELCHSRHREVARIIVSRFHLDVMAMTVVGVNDGEHRA